MAAVPEDDLPDSLRGKAVPEDDLPEAAPAPTKKIARSAAAPTPKESAGAYVKRRLVDPVVDSTPGKGYQESMKNPNPTPQERGYYGPSTSESGGLGTGIKLAAKTLASGVVEPAMSMASGLGSSIVGGVAGAGRALGGLLNDESFDTAMTRGGELTESIQRGGTYQPRGEAGKSVMRLLSAPVEGAKTVAGRVAGTVGGLLGGKQGEIAGESLGELGVDLALSKAPIGGLNKIRTAAKERLPLTQAEKATKSAQDAGFLAPIAKANPSLLNEVISDIAGPAGDKKTALKNQQTTNAKSKRALGIPEEEPLNPQTFSDYREKNAQAYARLRENATPFALDDEFKSKIMDLDKSMRSIKDTYPELYQGGEIERLRGSLLEPKNPAHPGKLTPGTVIDITRNLRDQATSVLKNPNASSAEVATALAKREASEALEGLLERHLERSGDKKLLTEFKEARKNIAASHDVETATNLTTGDVDATVLRRLLDKGRPLSGELKEIAEASRALPTVVRNTERMTPGGGVHAGDIGVATLLSHIAHSPKYLASVMARPAAASLASSRMMQGTPKGGRQPVQFPLSEAALASLITQPEEESKK